MTNPSIKSSITNYIILKILCKVYLANQRINSEKSFSQRFGCSRLTARSALGNLVQLNILTTKKGSGYTVSENAIKIILPSYYVAEQAHEITLTPLGEKNGFKTFLNVYYNQKKHLVGKCYWNFASAFYDIISRNYKDEKDLNLLIINSNSLNFNYQEHVEVYNDFKNPVEVFLVRHYFHKNGTEMFNFSLLYENFVALTKRNYTNYY